MRKFYKMNFSYLAAISCKSNKCGTFYKISSGTWEDGGMNGKKKETEQENMIITIISGDGKNANFCDYEERKGEMLKMTVTVFEINFPTDFFDCVDDVH